MKAADRDDMNDRTCIVTRTAGDPDQMIRFVVGPDGMAVPDIRKKLPGRGCWVCAERSLVDRAVAKKAFSRGFKAKVDAPEDLGETVDRLLAADLLGMMAMARKAGAFVTGSTKVDQAVRSGEALAVFHTTDAADDGVRKLDQARKAVLLQEDWAIESFRLFTADEMAAHLGEGALIHAAALAGQAGEGVVKRAMKLHRYRHGA